MVFIDNDLMQYLRIIRTIGVGSKMLQTLLARYSYGEAILVLGEKFSVPTLGDIEREATALEKMGGRYLFPKDYPTVLKNLDYPPMCLTALGNVDLLRKPIISIVGGRNASFQGRRFTERLSQKFSENGYAICSGFARGIDTAAHKGAINGQTIAVFAGGVDHIYPQENKALYESIIASGGLILSEMAPGVKPLNTLFPRRNRIVAALCEKLIVVEASEHSGSMITAKYALDQGKDIYCVPGHPEDPRVVGCHRLIQNGAVLLHDADDLLETRSLEMEEKLQTRACANKSDNSQDVEKERKNVLYTSENLTHKGIAILDQLSSTPMPLEILCQQTRMNTEHLMQILTELELQNMIQRTWDGKIFRVF